MRNRLRALGLAILLCVGVSAQPEPVPSPGLAPREPLYLLLCDGQGRWHSERQARYSPPKELTTSGSLSTDWKALTNTSAFRRLSYTDRLALLAYPERLLASSWAAQYFAGRWVLVLKPVGEERIEGRFFDLGSGRETALVVSAEVEPGLQARSEALNLALERLELVNSPVLAGADAALYHRPQATHLSAQVHYETVEGMARAEAFGYQPCPDCFPGEFERQPVYDDLDYRLGQMVAEQIESQYSVMTKGDQPGRVQAIGSRLLRENRFLDQGYRFLVLDTETVNAYAAPTGPIYVTKGLLDILDSDDELAAVLGHELSHSERRHARKQYQQSQKASFIGLILTYATGLPLANLGADVIATVMIRGYSRGYELESDRDGMMAAYAAGYRPEDYLLVQQKLADLVDERGGGGAAWARSHPGGEKRLAQLRELLDRTAELRGQLDALQTWDPGLAGYLKGRLLALADERSELEEYLTRYDALARLVDRTPPVSPQNTSNLGPAVRAILDITLPAGASGSLGP